MLPSNIEQFISDLLSMGSLQLCHTRKKHLIMKKNFFFFFFKETCLSEKRKWTDTKEYSCSLAASRLWVPTPLDILLVPQNQLICPNCLYSIREKTLSSLRYPVLNHHHHNLTVAAFRTSSLTCFSFACICNPSVTCPFISSISHQSTDIPPSPGHFLSSCNWSHSWTTTCKNHWKRLLSSSLAGLQWTPHITTQSFTSIMQSWSGERKMKSKLLCLAYKLPFQPWPLLTLISFPSLHTYLLLPSSSSLTPKGTRLPLPSGLTMLSWNGLFMPL